MTEITTIDIGRVAVTECVNCWVFPLIVAVLLHFLNSLY